MSKRYGMLGISGFLLSMSLVAHGLEYPLPSAGNSLVGEIQRTHSLPGDNLSSIGMRYDIGYYEMVEANPDLPRSGSISPGRTVIIPSQFILPSIRQGVVVNLAELRLYYYPKDQNVVYTFPIGAGREGWGTPRTVTYIARKKEDPAWIPPPSIIAEARSLGKPIKRYYGPGPDNPLGKYALYLGIPSIRIHGTNLQPTVGRRVSHGCIRLYADDIKFMYENIPVGTRVQVTHEQNKVGWGEHILYLETEVPFREYHDSDSAKTAIAKATAGRPAVIDWPRVDEILNEQDGMPHPIGHDSSVSKMPLDSLLATEDKDSPDGSGHSSLG